MKFSSSLNSNGLYTLDFSKPYLVGRAAHQQKLRNAFSRVCSTESPSETLLVHGSSGTGKSTLICETLQEQAEAIGFFFVQGKFDQLKETARPFSAFSEAVSMICDSINRNKSGDERLVLLQEIKNSLGDDVPTLQKLVPKLSELRLDLLVAHDAVDNTTKRRRSIPRDVSTGGLAGSGSGGTRKTMGMYSSERAVNIFRSFFRAVCQPYCPVTLFLDDLHNADEASIELFKALSTDTKIKGLLLLASYRDNEVTQELNTCLKGIRRYHKAKAREQGPDTPLAVTQVAVENIDGGSLHDFLLHTLSLRGSPKTQELADEILKKTEGNCFFVIQFLLYLQMKGYLKYDLQLFEWTWDIRKVKEKTDVSDNIVEIVLNRIHMLPRTAQLVLLTAAFLGSTFDPDLVARLLHEEKQRRESIHDTLDDESLSRWEKMTGKRLNEETKEEIMESSIDDPLEAVKDLPNDVQSMRLEIEQQLELIVDFGLVQRATGTWFKFRHDRIQQAAYELIPEGKGRDMKHLRIGRMLRESIQEQRQDNEWMLFAAVDHLNLGCLQMTNDSDLVDLASLNLKAAEKASDNSAIFPATNYAFIGLFVLALSCNDLDNADKSTRHNKEFSHISDGQEFALGMYGKTSKQQDELKWKNHYNLSLDLACIGAEMSYCVGRFRLCLKTSDEVLRFARSLPDKVRTHLTRIDMAGSQGRLDQAVQEGKKVMELLGEKFPTSHTSVTMMNAFKQTKKVMKGKSKDQLKMLPEMENDNMINVMKLMSLVSTYADLSQDNSMMQLAWHIMLRMVEITVHHGFCEYTPVAYAGYGIIVSQLEETAAGAAYGQLAIQQLEKCEQSDVFAKVNLMVQSSLNHWTTPLALTLEPLLQSYNVGMSTGEVEDALLCAQVYSYHYFSSGLPLGPLTKDLEEYLKLMVEYKQRLAAQTARPLLQLAMNLCGRCRHPLHLDGEGLDEARFQKEVTNSSNSLAMRNYLLARLQLACLFGYKDEGKTRLQELNEHPDTHKIKATFNYCEQAFYEALTLIDQLKRTQGDLVKGPAHRNNKAAVKKTIKRMEQWVEEGAINCKDLLLLVKAEEMSIGKKPIEEKIRAYELAITTASRHGKLQLRAMASERAGKFLNTVGGYDFQAQSFILDARDLYKEWGAQALVAKLEAKHSFLASMTSAHQATGRNFRGRQRFHKMSTEQHKGMGYTDLRLPSAQR